MQKRGEECNGGGGPHKDFSAEQLSALLEVVAGRLWWVAVPRPSQPWSGLRKTEGRQFGHLMIEEGLVRVGLFTWSLRVALGDADEDQQDEGRREAGEEQESANVLRR